MRNSTKFITAGLVLACAVGYLAYAAMKDGWTTYHVTVDEFLQKPIYRTQHVRLAGKVDADNLTLGTGRLGAQFSLRGQSGAVPVIYKGVLPDLFKPACEVVVEGRLDPAGTFHAELLMTKCASKYEPNSPHANLKDNAQEVK